MVSSTPRWHFTTGKDPVPILQEARWAPGPVWTGGKSRPHRDSILDCPARSLSLYRLSYRAHNRGWGTGFNYVVEIKRKVDTEYLRLSRVDFRTLSVLYSYQNCVYLIKFVVASVGLCVTSHCLRH